ncbi:MAG: ferrous iron transport protein A [Negativicutes bacterium]|nr:ferrous iron transport protein A [Negativicutes bacterium]
MTLADLHIGRVGIITKVGGFGPLRRRLLDMGLTPKTKILVRKKAPLGDPIEISLRSYELTIRLEDANKIEIIEVSE